jgi:hypothetical protein
MGSKSKLTPPTGHHYLASESILKCAINSIDLSRHYEAVDLSAVQRINKLLLNPEVHYHVQISPPLDSVPGYLHTVTYLHPPFLINRPNCAYIHNAISTLQVFKITHAFLTSTRVLQVPPLSSYFIL